MAFLFIPLNFYPMELTYKPPVFIVAFLHGAQMNEASMQRIAEEVLKALPGAKAVFIEMPGHGKRVGQPTSSFTLDDLAADALNELRRKFGDEVPWSQVGLVGESTGALVFARMIGTLPEPPAFALFGEPPLSNRPHMKHVEAQLLAAGDLVSRKLAVELFRFDQPEVTTWHRYFMKLPCPSLLVYGECREVNTGPTERRMVLSIIGLKDIEALRSATSLVTVGVEGYGHRVLQAMPRYWASMLRGMLASSEHKLFCHTRFSP